jgi:hypothetical protein
MPLSNAASLETFRKEDAVTYTQRLQIALDWNSIFEIARMRLRWLEAVVPSEQTKCMAKLLKEGWDSLTLDGNPHPERLHQNRFDRYHKRVIAQLARHCPPELRIVK